jgi:glutathione peroxidase
MRKLWRTAANLIAMCTGALSRAPAGPVRGSAYDFEFQGIDGSPLRLSDWRGKVLLIVNTASLCGFTKQYAGLEELWRRYREAGLVVIGVPSNDFAGQEPKSEREIKAFCESKFGVTFPLTSKQVVSGSGINPFYRWAAEVFGPAGVPRWNFHKYLVGRDGRLLRSFSTRLPPAAPEITGWIEKALSGTAPSESAKS